MQAWIRAAYLLLVRLPPIIKKTKHIRHSSANNFFYSNDRFSTRHHLNAISWEYIWEWFSKNKSILFLCMELITAVNESIQRMFTFKVIVSTLLYIRKR